MEHAMELKPQDLGVLLKQVAHAAQSWTYAALGEPAHECIAGSPRTPLVNPSLGLLDAKPVARAIESRKCAQFLLQELPEP